MELCPFLSTTSGFFCPGRHVCYTNGYRSFMVFPVCTARDSSRGACLFFELKAQSAGPPVPSVAPFWASLDFQVCFFIKDAISTKNWRSTQAPVFSPRFHVMVLSRWWPACISWTIYHPLVTCSCFFRSVLNSGPVMPRFWSWTFSSVRYALRNASRWRQEKAILFMAVMKRMDPARAWWWSWPPLPGRRDDGWAVGWCRGLVSGVGWGIPFWRCEGGWEVFFCG